MNLIVSFCIIAVVLGATAAVDVYDKTLDLVINWNVLHETSRALENDSGSFPQSLKGEFATAILNSENKYVSATQSIYNWCGEILPVAEIYTKLLNDGAENNQAEKAVFLYMLDTGIGKMDMAMEHISQSSTHTNIALEKLTTVDMTIQSESGLQVYVSTGMGEIQSANNQLRRGIVAIEDLRNKSKETRASVGLSVTIETLIVRHSNLLMDQCRAYRRQHGEV